MQKVFDELTVAFRKNGGELSAERYAQIATKYTTLFEESDTIFLLLQASGYPISETGEGKYRLETSFTPYREQRYCVIDIETNGSKPGTSQVIEIGAVMIQDGKIIDRMETFVECAFLPEFITKITGIEPSDLIGAPTRREALIMLRVFMGDAVFVAHNATFDYTFLTASFNRFGLGDIGNPQLCTIELAKRTFESERYGLAYLNEFLGIQTATHHRAYSDAYSASKVMEKSFETLPEYVKTTDDLLRFSVSSRKMRKERGKKLRVKSEE
ncbi:MAG: 3'-5' exonuclease [Campylobacterota bacterium]|nr:3'-5' exonuclease [Campylobacterota bacterium]